MFLDLFGSSKTKYMDGRQEPATEPQKPRPSLKAEDYTDWQVRTSVWMDRYVCHCGDNSNWNLHTCATCGCVKSHKHIVMREKWEFSEGMYQAHYSAFTLHLRSDSGPWKRNLKWEEWKECGHDNRKA